MGFSKKKRRRPQSLRSGAVDQASIDIIRFY